MRSRLWNVLQCSTVCVHPSFEPLCNNHNYQLQTDKFKTLKLFAKATMQLVSLFLLFAVATRRHVKTCDQFKRELKITYVLIQRRITVYRISTNLIMRIAQQKLYSSTLTFLIHCKLIIRRSYKTRTPL